MVPRIKNVCRHPKKCLTKIYENTCKRKKYFTYYHILNEK